MTDAPLFEKINAWWQRVNGVRLRNERNLYVTHDEWVQIRVDFEAAEDELPEEVRRQRMERERLARLDGALDHFLGTPVVVDDEEAARQQERIAAAGVSVLSQDAEEK